MKNKEMTNEGERRDKRKRQKEGRGPTNKEIKNERKKERTKGLQSYLFSIQCI
jgi:hypothetical protein